MKSFSNTMILSNLLPMVEVANAVPSKHAVVLPLENTLKITDLTFSISLSFIKIGFSPVCRLSSAMLSGVLQLHRQRSNASPLC